MGDMTFDDRVRALLDAFHVTPRQARFLATVALHGGYCLRRQYGAFAGIRYGKNVCHFLDSLVERQLAECFRQRADRGLIYHLHARALYRAIGDEHNRNRRQASAAQIARRLMILDHVLAHPDREWLATERDKVDRFVERYHVPRADLPQRRFPASTPGAASTTRYFLHKLPIALPQQSGTAGDVPPVVSFVYLASDSTGRPFEQFLADHARLLAWLPAWTVVAIGWSPGRLAVCEAIFARARQRPIPAASTGVEDLRELFRTRQQVDRGELATLSVAAIDRYRTLRDQFAGPPFEALYAAWCRDGEAALAVQALAARRPGQSHGQLLIEALPFDYRQFGSLPGIA